MGDFNSVVLVWCTDQGSVCVGLGLLGFLLSHSTCHPKLYTTNCKVHKQIKPIFLITLLHLVTGEAVTHKIKYREPRNSRTKTKHRQVTPTHKCRKGDIQTHALTPVTATQGFMNSFLPFMKVYFMFAVNHVCFCHSVSLVRGHYPPELLKQWDIFHEKKNSENDRPGTVVLCFHFL